MAFIWYSPYAKAHYVPYHDIGDVVEFGYWADEKRYMQGTGKILAFSVNEEFNGNEDRGRDVDYSILCEIELTSLERCFRDPCHPLPRKFEQGETITINYDDVLNSHMERRD